MPLHCPQLLWWCIVLFWMYSTNALCPSNCICHRTDSGMKRIGCLNGGMHGVISTTGMDSDLEILDITAPKNNWNKLSLSAVFQHFKNLEEIHIRKSSIVQIGMHTFWGVPTLKLLDFSFNNISVVFDHNFRGLVNLIQLNLDNNKIKHLQAGVFKHLTELRILNLQHNFINNLVAHTFLKLGKLHVLKLSANIFDELNPEAFKDIPELRILECRGCGLRRINTQIYHLLPYLLDLDLGNNQMQFISSDEFNDLHNLHSLKLDGNQLPVVLEKTFVNQHQLKYLCLARNRLAKITNTAFLNLTNLINLDIGYNKLSKIDGIAFQHVSNTLQRLVISGNNFDLKTIQIILQTLYKVWDLELARMNIKTLPTNFLPHHLRKLNLCQNNITDVNNYKIFPKQLKELDLSENKIKEIKSERVIFKLDNLIFLNLSINPWSCTLCHLNAFISRLNKTKNFQNLTCAYPPELKGKQFHHLNTKILPACKNLSLPNEFSHIFVFFIGIAVLILFILVILCIIFVVCSCWKRQQRCWHLQNTTLTMDKDEDDHPTTAIFSKNKVTFKFPLDLTENGQRMSVSVIDKIKTVPSTIPNGI